MSVRQVGGDHYSAEYQHWDWVTELRMCYLLGNATKYVSRHRRKGRSEEDLRKAVSYYRKMIELWDDCALPLDFTNIATVDEKTRRFTDGMGGEEARICLLSAKILTKTDVLDVIRQVEALLPRSDVEHPSPFGYQKEREIFTEEDLDPRWCSHCDLGSGYRGGDRCEKCDGTGAVFVVVHDGGLRYFPNTAEGAQEALALMNS